MKSVAIIGAGLSGVSCAHELMRYGIIPTIFEKTATVGGKLDFPVAVLKMFNVPSKDPVKHLKKHYNINVKPFSEINEFTMKGPTKSLTVRANLGLIFRRPPYSDSLESQIVKDYDPPVTFNTFAKASDLKNSFDYVVVATANMLDTMELGLFDILFDSHVRVATVTGRFKPGCVTLWFNTEYAKKAYAYLIPVDAKEARFALIVDNITRNELEHYWKEFFAIEDFPYKIVSTRDVEHRAGVVDPVQKDNILLTGNAGGFLDNVLGFGSMGAIVSGVTAARSIACGLDYTRMVKPFTEDIKKKNDFRKVINTFENKDFDRLITLLGLPGINHLIYHNPFFTITQGTALARLYNSIKGKEKA